VAFLLGKFVAGKTKTSITQKGKGRGDIQSIFTTRISRINTDFFFEKEKYLIREIRV